MEGTSIEEFEKQALEEADQMAVDSIKDNAEVSKLIYNSKSARDSIEVDGVVIRFHPFISRQIRHKISAMRRDVNPDDANSTDEIVYQTLALLCTEEPWNNPLTWRGMEIQGGDAQGYLARIMGKIAEKTDKMRNFRKVG
jgi:hypothetical protein